MIVPDTAPARNAAGRPDPGCPQPAARAGGTYPRRCRNFDRWYLRLLVDADAAGEIGGAGCVLVTTVVLLECVARYSGPIALTDGQALFVTGLASVEDLGRVRDAAVRSGWLTYVPGDDASSGWYFVLTPAGLANRREGR